MKKKILLALIAIFAFAGVARSLGTSSPITGFSWDNVRKVVRMMTSDGQEITVDQTPKQYVACTGTATTGCAYNGVNLVVTGPTGWTVVRAVFTPYRTADGVWRLKGTISASMTGTTSASVGIAGISIAAYNQPVTVGGGASLTGYTFGYASGGSNLLIYYQAAYTAAMYYFDIELTSKPTWAD